MYFTVLSLDKPSDDDNEKNQTLSFSHETLNNTFDKIRHTILTLPSDTKVTDIHIKVID